MKVMPISQFRREIYRVLEDDQVVLITRWGKPKAFWVPFQKLSALEQREALSALEKWNRKKHS